MKFALKTVLAAMACGMVLLSTAHAEVFQYRDAFGRVHLTDKPMRGMKLVKRYSISTGRINELPRLSSNGNWAVVMKKRRDAVAPLIEKAAADTNLKPALVHAVIRAESAYRPDAVSSKGAVGLMQLMPGTAERYGVTDRYDPEQNIRGGTTYLRDLLLMFEGDIELAVAAYNAGENAVIKYGNKIPPYRETQGYVRKVLAFYESLAESERVALR